MAAPVKRPQETEVSVAKVKVIGGGGVIYGNGLLGVAGEEIILTLDEFESVKHRVEKI